MSRLKIHLWFCLTSATLLGVSACQDKTAAPETPAISESPAAPATPEVAVQTSQPRLVEPKIDMVALRAAQFQADCRERITAKMIEPDAANITYVPTSQPDAYTAQVELLNRETGGVIRLDFDCRRNANGEITTKMITD